MTRSPAAARALTAIERLCDEVSHNPVDYREATNK
jgi:hypothetical protein